MGSTLWSKRHEKYKPKKRKRPKTFKTEESAGAWAEKHGIKQYKLVNLKSPESRSKKIRIVVEGK